MNKWKLIVYWKDKDRTPMTDNINAMDIQGDNIICGTLDGGTIIINAKLIIYIKTYLLKDGK